MTSGKGTPVICGAEISCSPSFKVVPDSPVAPKENLDITGGDCASKNK